MSKTYAESFAPETADRIKRLRVELEGNLTVIATLDVIAESPERDASAAHFQQLADGEKG